MVKKFKIVILLALVFQFGFAQNLKLNLKKGKTYYQTTNSKSNIHQEINGEMIEMEMLLKGKMSFKVLNRKSDYYEMEVTFKSLSMSMNSPFDNVSFDSENKSESDIYTKILGQMINQQFLIKMNKNGTIREINMNNIFDRLLDSFPEIPKAYKNEIIAQIRQAYGEKAFMGNLEMITAIFPDKKVKVNDSWSNEIRLESGMGATMDNLFVLKELNKSFALIDLNSKTVTDDANSYIPINGAFTKYNLSGTMKSTIKIDSNSGWIISSNMLQNLNGNVEIKKYEDSMDVQTIPINFENSMLITGE